VNSVSQASAVPSPATATGGQTTLVPVSATASTIRLVPPPSRAHSPSVANWPALPTPINCSATLSIAGRCRLRMFTVV
jgi:hypothetical protein